MRAFLRVFGASALFVSVSAIAAPHPPARPIAPVLPRDIAERLASGDAAKIRSAFDDIRLAGRAGAPAVPGVVELLRKGLDAKLTLAAIDTLADTEAPTASDTVAWYARHRDLDIRRAAIKALAKTQGLVAVKALRQALSDPDAQVRGLAATALGSAKAKDAVPDLFAALDHKVNEAATSLGLLCGGDECDRLASKLGVLPFDVVIDGLDQILFRPPSDVSDDVKVKILGRIRALGTAEAHKFLVQAQGKWPATWSQRVKQTLEEAIVATSAGSGGGAP
jgi:HEAT repeat protein